MQKQKPKHIPVLLKETVNILKPKVGESYADMTAGYGGHAKAILSITGEYGSSILIDRDMYAQDTLLATFAGSGIDCVQSDFLAASKKLVAENRQFDMILADVGVSSPHIDNASRGFTYSGSNPLDMRMDPNQELTAYEIVNSYEEAELVRILKVYGEEPKARSIVKAIMAQRPIANTEQLAQIVARLYPGRSKKHPATRTFQALRIAVNDELTQLKEAIPLWLELLRPGGRLAIITFHSLEDRIVKQAFAESATDTYDASYRMLTKGPIVATNEEIVFNPRARSAKLRGVVKIKNERE